MRLRTRAKELTRQELPQIRTDGTCNRHFDYWEDFQAWRRAYGICE